MKADKLWTDTAWEQWGAQDVAEVKMKLGKFIKDYLEQSCSWEPGISLWARWSS